MQFEVSGMYIADMSGEFTREDGKVVPYHKARFLSVSDGSVFKASFNPDAVSFPPQAAICTLIFDCVASDKNCYLRYLGFEE